MLDELVGGRWTVLLTHPLREGGQTTFTLPARKISVTYRVVLSATAKHRQSVSALVQVAPHQNKGGGGGGKGQGGG